MSFESHHVDWLSVHKLEYVSMDPVLKKQHQTLWVQLFSIALMVLCNGLCLIDFRLDCKKPIEFPKMTMPYSWYKPNFRLHKKETHSMVTWININQNYPSSKIFKRQINRDNVERTICKLSIEIRDEWVPQELKYQR